MRTCRYKCVPVNNSGQECIKWWVSCIYAAFTYMLTEAMLHECAVASLRDQQVSGVFAPSAKTWTLRQPRLVQDAHTHLEKRERELLTHKSLFLHHHQRHTLTIWCSHISWTSESCWKYSAFFIEVSPQGHVAPRYITDDFFFFCDMIPRIYFLHRYLKVKFLTMNQMWFSE